MRIKDQITEPGFDDVLLQPQRSEIDSRNDVTLEREIKFSKSNRTWKGIPIIASNMSTIGTFKIYNVLSKYKMITCLHKFYDIDDYPKDLNPNYYMLSTGISESDEIKIDKLINKLNPYFVCIDVANGYAKAFVEYVKKFKNKYPDITLVAGNVVSKDMVHELVINAGVDIVKVGIGSGAMCLTRLKTGVGRSQLSAIDDCAFGAHGVHGHIISDGGIRYPGDIIKAYAVGADFVMIGSMFGGSKEASGMRIFNRKLIYGMSSFYAQKKHNGFIRKYSASEGRKKWIKYTGPIENTINDILGGIRSACAYIGARRIKDIPKCHEFEIVNKILNTHFSEGK